MQCRPRLVVELPHYRPSGRGVVCRQRHCGVLGERPSNQRGAFAAIISSTFVRSEGLWLLAFHQQSPV
jgi:hypothetical protein